MPAGLYRRAGHKVVPRRSGVHRFACLILYKHLLRQIPHSPLDQELLKDILRAEFRCDARLRIHADIRQSLTTGYRALSLLQAIRKQSQTSQTTKASLESSSNPLSQHITHLNQNLQKLCLSRAPAPIPPILPDPPRLWPYPGGNKILSRPLPASEIIGRRHIPKLVNASGLPFLRVKKPQPPLISKILRDKLATRQKRQDQLMVLEGDLVWAKDEDEWDLVLEGVRRDEVSGIEEREGEAIGEKGFAENMRESIKHVNGLLNTEAAKQADLAKRLWGIVLQERKLAEEEAKEKKQVKLDEWLEGVKERREARGLEWEDRSAMVGKE